MFLGGFGCCSGWDLTGFLLGDKEAFVLSGTEGVNSPLKAYLETPGSSRGMVLYGLVRIVEDLSRSNAT